MVKGRGGFVAFLLLYDYCFYESKTADAVFAYMSFFTGNSDTYEPASTQNSTTSAQAPEPALATAARSSSTAVVTTKFNGAQAPSNASNTGSIERASVCEEWNTLEILMFPFILLAMATLSLVTFFVEDDLRSDATPAYGI